MRLVIFGPPGAGKGTYSKLISERYNIPHIATGDMIREEIHKGTELGTSMKKFVEGGGLVPDEIVIEILRRRISAPDCKNGFILDGFPRTTAQAKALEKIADVDLVINLTVPEDVIIRRLSSRRVCRNCGAIYNLISMPPSRPGVCDKCGGELYQREDDKPEVIRRRLKEYETQTKPLVEYYGKKSIIRDVALVKEEKVEEVIKRVYDIIETTKLK